ncbi:MAG: hypothetical protein WAT25_03640, partial [Paracoccaceae bacterium]
AMAENMPDMADMRPTVASIMETEPDQPKSPLAASMSRNAQMRALDGLRRSVSCLGSAPANRLEAALLA